MTVDTFQRMKNGQMSLIRLYAPIERGNGVYSPENLPVDLNSRHGQTRLKDLAWRLNEELMCEVMLAPKDQMLEEVIDAVHFYLELIITAGLEGSSPFEKSFLPGTRPVESCVVTSSTYLARAMHHLKLRPWKQSYRPTDEAAFFHSLRVCGHSIGEASCALGIRTEEELAEHYFMKNGENLQRIAGGY